MKLQNFKKIMKDYQLDLINAVNNYNANMIDEKEAIIVLMVDTESKASIMNIEGNMVLLCETINFPETILKQRSGCSSIGEGVDMIINVLLSLSTNIIINNPKVEKEFISQIDFIKKAKKKIMKQL